MIWCTRRAKERGPTRKPLAPCEKELTIPRRSSKDETCGGKYLAKASTAVLCQLSDPVPRTRVYPLVRQHRRLPDLLHEYRPALDVSGDVGRVSGGGRSPKPRRDGAAAPARSRVAGV